MKSLVIVESPAKAKTINKYLGKDYVVKSSVGHIRDLDKFPKVKTTTDKQLQSYYKLIQQMGVDPEDGWNAQYSIINGKKKVIDELKKYAKECDLIYLASDLDREGESIAWHVMEILGGDKSKYKRVIFNEITSSAIKKAFENPIELDMHKVYSQHARRYLDRVVGYMLSPLLWKKVARGLSAGRVQSVALRLITEREKEIADFNAQEYWELDAKLKFGKKTYTFDLKKIDGKDVNIPSQKAVESIQKSIANKPFIITKREEKQTKNSPLPPFITSTLQQGASTRLGFGLKKTMTLAQRLYEGGYITYMRTDSTNISQEALSNCRSYIEKGFGAHYVPDAPRYYKGKENAQEAHEAIRPSDVHVSSNVMVDLGKDAQNLYELIRSRFIASQMKDAIYIGTALQVDVENKLFQINGRITLFDGYTKVYGSGGNQEDVELDKDMKEGTTLNLQEWDARKKFTKPPARYNEASVVKELEKRGIGRPSTYASIISTIEERGYVKIVSKRFFLQRIGGIVVDKLVSGFDDLMSYDFTAGMEKKLDDIVDGKDDWKKVLDNFFIPFKKKVDVASSEKGMPPNLPTPTDIPCKVCATGKMKIRTASTGIFLSCSNYELSPKERCKATVNLIEGTEAQLTDEDEAVALRSVKNCKICGSKMDDYILDANKKIHVCRNNPNCSGYEVEEGNFKIKGYEGPVIECDKCGADMQLKMGRFGKYFGCTQCKNTRKLLRSGEVAKVKMDPIAMHDIRCEKVDDYYLLRDGERGLFLAASKFPKNREIRSIYVDELLQYEKEVPEKHRYLLSAPTKDDKGNRALIKYDKKGEIHYVMTEKNSKATTWKSHYVNGKWEK